MMQPQDPGGGLSTRAGGAAYAEPGTRAQLLALHSLLQRRPTHSAPRTALGEPGAERAQLHWPRYGGPRPPPGPQKLVPCHLRPGQGQAHLPDEPHAAAYLCCAGRLLPAGPPWLLCQAAAAFRTGCQQFAAGFVCEYRPRAPAGTQEAPAPAALRSKCPSSLLGGPSPHPSPVPTAPARQTASLLQLSAATASFFRILNAHTYSGTCTHAHTPGPRPGGHESRLSGAAPAKTARQWAVKTQLLHASSRHHLPLPPTTGRRWA